MVNLCMNCAHYKPLSKGFLTVWGCRRPTTDELSPVDGSPLHRLNAWADSERKPGRTLFGRKRCGPEGQFFEPPTDPTAKLVWVGKVA